MSENLLCSESGQNVGELSKMVLSLLIPLILVLVYSFKYQKAFAQEKKL